MLKVLFILPNLQPGGAERVTITILENLNQHDFSTTLFLIRKDGELLKDIPPWVNVVSALNPKQNLLIFLPYVLFIFLRSALRNDVYFGCLELTVTYLAYIAGKIFRRPTLGWVHINLHDYQPSLGRFHKFLSNFIYPKLDKILVVSKGVFESILLRFPKIGASNIEIIYNPIPIENIIQKSKEAVALSVNKKLIIIGVGRLSPQKRFDVLIRAHADLIKKGVNQELIILGEGSEKVFLVKLIQSLNLHNSVKLLGYQPNPYKFMRMADFFVLSSDFEGLPTVILEALTLGLPIIATDCPSGPSEILSEGMYGVLVPLNNHEAIADAVQGLLIDKTLASKLKRLGPIRAKQFSSVNVVPRFEELLKRVFTDYYNPH